MKLLCVVLLLVGWADCHGMVSKITIGGKVACAHNLGSDMRNGGRVDCNSNIKVRAGKPRAQNVAGPGCNVDNGPDHCILDMLDGDPGRNWDQPQNFPSTPCLSGQSFGQNGVMDINTGEIATIEVLMNAGGDHGGLHSIQMVCGTNPSNQDFLNNFVVDWHVTSQPKDRRGQRIGRTKEETDRYLDSCGNHCRYNFGDRPFDTLPLQFRVDKCAGQSAVIRWLWYGRETNQIYAKCLDVRVGGNAGDNPAPAPAPRPSGPAPCPGMAPAPRPAPAPAPQPAGCSVAKFDQCGGQGYNGCRTCTGGTSCQVQNQWYSQCLPASAAMVVAEGTTDTLTCSPDKITAVAEAGKSACGAAVTADNVCVLSRKSPSCYGAIDEMCACDSNVKASFSVCREVAAALLDLSGQFQEDIVLSAAASPHVHFAVLLCVLFSVLL